MIIIMQDDKQHRKTANMLFEKYYAAPLRERLRGEKKGEDEIRIEVEALRQRKIKHYKRDSTSQEKQPESKVSEEKQSESKASEQEESWQPSIIPPLSSADLDDGERLTFIGHGSRTRFGAPREIEVDNDDKNGLTPMAFAAQLIKDIDLFKKVKDFNIKAMDIIACNIGVRDKKDKSYVQSFVNELYKQGIENLGSALPPMPSVMAFTDMGGDLYSLSVRDYPGKDGMLVLGFLTAEDRNEVRKMERLVRDAAPEDKNELSAQKVAKERELCVYVGDKSQRERICIDCRAFFDQKGIVKPQVDKVKKDLQESECEVFDQYMTKNPPKESSEKEEGNVRFVFGKIPKKTLEKDKAKVEKAAEVTEVKETPAPKPSAISSSVSSAEEMPKDAQEEQLSSVFRPGSSGFY